MERCSRTTELRLVGGTTWPDQSKMCLLRLLGCSAFHVFLVERAMATVRVRGGRAILLKIQVKKNFY